MNSFNTRISIISSPRVKPQMNPNNDGSSIIYNEHDESDDPHRLSVSMHASKGDRNRKNFFNYWGKQRHMSEDNDKNDANKDTYQLTRCTSCPSLSLQDSGVRVPARSSQRKCKSDVGVDHRVSFSKIYVREYERVLGDNPSVTSGPPISIGWKHTPEDVYDVDDFEWNRSSNRFLLNSGRLSEFDREEMLRDKLNIPPALIRKAALEARKVKVERFKSYCESQRFSRMKNIFTKFGGGHRTVTKQAYQTDINSDENAEAASK